MTTTGRQSARGSKTVLAKFGVREDQLIGVGSWSRLYALDGDLVLRVLPDRTKHPALLRLQHFYRSLSRGNCTLGVPDFLEVGEAGGASFVIERRVAGISLAQRLTLGGAASDALLLERLLAAIGQLDSLLTPPCEAGELLAGTPVRARSWRQFLITRAANELAKGRDALNAAGCDVPSAWTRFEAALNSTDDNARILVHGDLHPGNAIVDSNDQIVGLIDFGPMTLAGDPELDRIWARLNWPGGVPPLLQSCTTLGAPEQAYLLFWAFRFANIGARSPRLFLRSVAIMLALTSSPRAARHACADEVSC